MIPSNHSTLKPYRGINVLNLNWIAIGEGWPNTWGTFNMWKKESDKLNKKMKKEDPSHKNKWFGVQKIKDGDRGGSKVFYWNMLKIEDKKTKEEKVIPLLKVFTVFNIAQTAMPKPKKKRDRRKMLDIEKDIKNMVKEHEINFSEGGNRAFFNYSRDFVKVPNRKQFKTLEDRASTILHEFTHWTGHPSRLNRDMKGSFGSEDYAKEELVAELGSAILCQSLGLSIDGLQHNEYIGSWIKKLKEPSGYQYLFRASAKAQKAVDYLLKTEFKKEDKK